MLGLDDIRKFYGNMDQYGVVCDSEVIWVNSNGSFIRYDYSDYTNRDIDLSNELPKRFTMKTTPIELMDFECDYPITLSKIFKAVEKHLTLEVSVNKDGTIDVYSLHNININNEPFDKLLEKLDLNPAKIRMISIDKKSAYIVSSLYATSSLISYRESQFDEYLKNYVSSYIKYDNNQIIYYNGNDPKVYNKEYQDLIIVDPTFKSIPIICNGMIVNTINTEFIGDKRYVRISEIEKLFIKK